MQSCWVAVAPEFWKHLCLVSHRGHNEPYVLVRVPYRRKATRGRTASPHANTLGKIQGVLSIVGISDGLGSPLREAISA